MKKNVSLSILFHPRWERIENNSAVLCLRITVNGQRKTISLKQKVEISKWNSQKEILNGNDAVTKSVNTYIAQTRGQVHEVFRELQKNGEFISVETLKSKFLGNDENEQTLNQVIEYHNKTMEGHLACGTAKNYFTTQKYIKEFLNTKLKKEDVYLPQLNYKFLADFEMFLRTHVPGENQRPCGNNTVMKHIERFRKIVSMAVRNDWLKTDPFQNFKPKFIKKDRGFLTQEELTAIENKVFTIARLDTVRDLFIFSCYTGLAYSDALMLSQEEIQFGIDGKKWLTTNRIKTGVRSTIPLLPKPLEIIEKYKDHPRSRSFPNRVLPMMSNQTLNGYLKEIETLCGISKNLTHHLARHTFATTVCLLNGISMEATSGMLGHSSMRTTQIYGKILPQRISNEMGILEKKLQSKNNSVAKEIKIGS